MNIIYLKLIYIFNASIILFVFLVGKNISADQTATIIANEIKSNNLTEVIDAKGDVMALREVMKKVVTGYTPEEEIVDVVYQQK